MLHISFVVHRRIHFDFLTAGKALVYYLDNLNNIYIIQSGNSIQILIELSMVNNILLVFTNKHNI